MADAVTTQVLLDGERLYIGKFTNISDGTGETGVVKIDVATLAKSRGFACNGLKINRIWASTHGLEVRILWKATTDSLAWMVTQQTFYDMSFDGFGGITNDAGAGSTGSIAFTTVDAGAGDMYTIIIECIKTYATS
jgi:hypothetical protein